MVYNPFASSNFDDLCPRDLACLVDVPEGWFIEYKQEPCGPDKYAKAVSAFANAHGGYLFVGLEEDARTRCPSGGPGLPRDTITRTIDSVRDSIAQHLSPTPYFEIKVVDGPIPQLAIPVDRCVVVVHVPESKNTPHIHSSGRIYRRQADAAEPISITDRAELDELYSRHSKFVELLDQELEFGLDDRWVAEFSTPWVHIAIASVPARRHKLLKIGIDRFRRILSSTPDSVRFPDIYPSALGYVARNARHQDIPDGPAVTFEYALGGAFYVTIPLSTTPWSPGETVSFCHNQIGKEFASLLRTRSFQHAKLLDGTYLSSNCWGLGVLIQQIAQEVGIQGEVFIRIQLRNTFRCIPFFNSSSYLEWCKTHTVPVIHRGSFQIPPFKKHWLAIGDLSSTELTLMPLVHILATFGVSAEIVSAVTQESVHASS